MKRDLHGDYDDDAFSTVLNQKDFYFGNAIFCGTRERDGPRVRRGSYLLATYYRVVSGVCH